MSTGCSHTYAWGCYCQTIEIVLARYPNWFGRTNNRAKARWAIKADTMCHRAERGCGFDSPANDDGAAESRVESAVFTTARLIGRQIAREAFERSGAANDNALSPDAGEDREIR